MMSGMSCVCAELGGSGKPAGDRGGNLEPRVAATWMQGRSTLQATDVRTRCTLRSVHKVHAEQPRSDCNIEFHGLVMVAARFCGNNSAPAPFLHHDTTREYAFAIYVLLLWHGCRSADVGVPSQWLWTSGRL